MDNIVKLPNPTADGLDASMQELNKLQGEGIQAMIALVLTKDTHTHVFHAGEYSDMEAYAIIGVMEDLKLMLLSAIDRNRE